MKRTQGFTLLEILLVLVLLSLSAVAVIAAFPISQKDESKLVVQSLYQRIQLINEEAILSGQDFGLRVDQDKNRLLFLTLTAEGWQILEKPQFNAEIEVPSDLKIDFQLGGNTWGNDDRLFEPGSLFDEDMFADQEEKKQQKPPQIFILSSGEVTPVMLSIHPLKDQLEQSWRVVVKDNGQIQLLAPGEQDEEV
ncbi:type II secretion system minor pseudopilin GspH [Vibrio ziniensis]|uniref:Type II secretion system protein H n=1 Tax=Vibrio ziniensis TaxID=2711221 RepID=A0A6G7CET6_9VIBR|nr:type II secretion system minor pseudopilin GspH [Vibrio ziniensis]QIH40583.1 type II secretion system minor pseudopilin GspH [Vibrio ziniensis]